MPRTLPVLLLLLCVTALPAADPAPFADLDAGPSLPERLEDHSYRRYLAEAGPEGRTLLKAAYWFDRTAKRHRLQPGLPPEALPALDAVFRKAAGRPGLFRRIWQDFLRLNTDIQDRVAALLQRVRREPPLTELRHCRAGGRDIFAFSSPSTRGLKLVILQGDRILATETLPGGQPPALACLADGRVVAGTTDGRSLHLAVFSPQGTLQDKMAIPFVHGERLVLRGLSGDVVLVVWEREGAVQGGVLDLATGTLRRFPPLPGYTLPEQDPAPFAGVYLYRDARLLRLLWDGGHGVTVPQPLFRAAGRGVPRLVHEQQSLAVDFSGGDMLYRFTPQGGTLGALKLAPGTVYLGGGQRARLADGKLLFPDTVPEHSVTLPPDSSGRPPRLLPVPGGVLLVRFQGNRLTATEYRTSGQALPSRDLHGQSPLSLVLVLLVISVAYGFIHASGPGHGKMLVAAYFVDNTHHGWWPPAKMALIISSVHTGSALLLATLFQVILSVSPDQMAVRTWFTIGSGLLVIGLGLWMLVERLRGRHEERVTPTGKRTMLALGVAAGIVPCPLAMGVMVIAVMHGVYPLGVLSVFGMSAGMFLILFLIGALTSRSREKLEQLLSRKNRAARVLGTVAGVASALVIIVLGVALLAPVL